MMEIRLSNLRCYAYHGVYQEEQKTGQEFIANLSLFFQESDTIREVGETIDYTNVYKIFRDCMAEREALLETVAMKLAADIHQAYPFVQEINISIDKTAPPIPNFDGQVGITYRKQFTGT